MRHHAQARFRASALLLATTFGLSLSSESAVARSDRDERLKQLLSIARPTTPLKLIVSIRRQHLSVWDGVKKIAEAPISSGMRGHETPTGVFSILEKNKVHFSNLYNNAPMPFMQRLTWSGVALHAGALPGYPASHGCIRLPFSFAKQLFDLARVGARVVVARDDAEPRMIAHSRLPVPLPPSAIPSGDVAAAVPFVTSVANGTVADARSGNLDLLFAVPAAVAADAAPDAFTPQRTRASVAAARAAKLAGHTDAILKAEIQRDYDEARTKDAALDVRDAMELVDAARDEMKPFEVALQAALRGKTSAQAQLAAFIARNRQAGGFEFDTGGDIEGKLAALGSEEDRLEGLVHSLLFEIEDLELELADHRGSLDRLLETVANFENQRREAQQSLARSNEALKQAQLAKTSAERAMQRQNLPITMFVSRKTGKLLVRQGAEPLFDAAVKIDNPDAPLGTHVFTALDYATGERQLNWSVVSVAAGGKEPDRDTTPARPRSRETAVGAPPPARPNIPQTASASLDRIRISDDVLERLAEYVKPGSTFMISDVDVSHETGKGTDVVLLTRQ